MRKLKGVEYWNGEPVQKKKPERCPNCGSKNLDIWFDPEMQEWDAELAAKCGYEGEDHPDWDAPGAEFYYTFDLVECEDCSKSYAFEPRCYWDAEQGDYYAESRPKTPAELAAEENARQEAAGQIRLL